MKHLLVIALVVTMAVTQVNAQRVYKSNGGNKNNKENTYTTVSIPKKEYIIRVNGTNAYWDIPGHPGYKDGVNKLQVWGLDNGADRKVMFLPAGDGYYYIKFSHNNYYLDVAGGRLNKDDYLQIYQANRTNAQKFKVIHKGNGQFKFLTVNGWALDCEGGKWKNGTRIQLWEDHNGQCQTFEIIEANTKQKFFGK